MSVIDAFAKLKQAPVAPKKEKAVKKRPLYGRAIARPFLRGAKAHPGGSISSAELAADPVVIAITPGAEEDGRSKAVGDACGKHKQGLDLFRNADDSYPFCWENGSKVVRQFKTTEELELLAKDVGCSSAEEMIEFVNGLPGYESC